MIPATTPISTTPSIIPKSHTLPLSKQWESEQQQRKDKGLCYRCGDPFLPGHRCKSALSIMEYRDSTNNVILEAADEETRLYEQEAANDGATSISYLPP
ncbi:hypothetical protein LIER_01579 [Lithospermum erythrorhizon]|uniref:Uncharacterized protein n=1 Tax=Lithospermum erythrorhizon TaxID=34254 RepID=A0AAV3NQ28_LITER